MMEKLLGQVKARILDVYKLEFQVETRQSEEKQRGQQLQSYFALLEHFRSLFLHTIYHFKALKSRIQLFKPCTIWIWMLCDGLDAISWKFLTPEVISYELLEGEVFNSKFCINPLEPISMVIERSSVKEANLVPIILGRPFLATSNAIINCRNGLMQLTFGNMTLDLNIFYMSKSKSLRRRRRSRGGMYY
ncbi:hypothetical protein AAG906_013152 [Vitis piasezkii]